MHVLEDCPKMEHSTRHFQVLFNREESKFHFFGNRIIYFKSCICRYLVEVLMPN